MVKHLSFSLKNKNTKEVDGKIGEELRGVGCSNLVLIPRKNIY